MNDTNIGVEFNFSYAPGVTDDQILGFEIAGDIVSQHLADSFKGKNLEINIHVDKTNEYLPDDVVGASFPTIETGIKYQKIYDAIQDDITTSQDIIVADNLIDQKKIDVLVGGEVIDKNHKTHVTSANLKALGLKKGNHKELDGYILINDFGGDLWSYDYLGTPEAGKLDFLSMAQHEIGHVLGFISGAKHTEDTVGKRIKDMTTMDLFRFSTESVELGINDLTYGQTSFFSINGEVSTLELTTGVNHQVAHILSPLKSESSNGQEHALMSPNISLGERWSLTGSDLLVLDAIGWDVVNPGAIDMAAIYSNAQAQLGFAKIKNRQKEFEEVILTQEAYNWGRSGRSSSGSGWWLKGYFMQIETNVDAETGETQYHVQESGADEFWQAVEVVTSWIADNWGAWWESSSSNNWWESSASNNWWERDSSSTNNWWESSSSNNWWKGNSDDDDDD
ncbi:MAG: NF038122 family metalloprotease [Cyanobacteria bacterium P01_G01_bin.19]